MDCSCKGVNWHYNWPVKDLCIEAVLASSVWVKRSKLIEYNIVDLCTVNGNVPIISQMVHSHSLGISWLMRFRSLTPCVYFQDSDDVRYMVAALKTLGVLIEEDWAACELVVHGCRGRFPAEGGDLFLGNAGTAMRPLTAAVAAAGRGRLV